MPISKTVLGALIAFTTSPDQEDERELPILLRTFSQGLTTLWRNLDLLLETQQRTRELEILTGRYVDTVWGSSEAALEAKLSRSGLEIERKQEANLSPLPDNHIAVPLRLGDLAFGRVDLPGDVALSRKSRRL
ncbi:MAG: hypothetical protein M5U34_00830 [Chloroflexi bacterium]|nr:hypothetical protein [Chloroflexota bacterium]